MSISLKDFEEEIKDIAPEVRDVQEGSFLEASCVMSPADLATYPKSGKSRLAGMQGGLSTRTGAAMRHAGQHLLRQPEKRKLLTMPISCQNNSHCCSQV